MIYSILLLISLQISADHQNVKAGLALSGYDPVSYFQEAGPLKGSKDYKTTYRGATYYFASGQNAQAFKRAPEKYAPQYGGWCAYAMGVNGDKVKVDPKTYKILDDRLYLFYNFWGNNTLTSWNEDEQTLRMNADKYWSRILASR